MKRTAFSGTAARMGDANDMLFVGMLRCGAASQRQSNKDQKPHNFPVRPNA
jgi:hypothetical protein